MKFSKIPVIALLAGMSMLAAAADLTFDLQISRGAPKDYNPEIQKKTVAVFVIDCSGSMKLPYEDPKTGRSTRWTRVGLICEKLLPERFEALPAGAEVLAYLYGVTDKNCWGGRWLTKRHQTLDSREKKAAFLRDLQQSIDKRVSERGATPYYDTMERVLRGIQEAGWLNDPKINLELYDYSDGANATNGFDDDFFYASHAQAPSYHNDLVRLARRFNGKWGSFLKQIAQKGFYEQLNLGTKKENPGVKHIPAFKVNFTCDDSGLKSPGETASQKVPLYASFPVNQECWDLLKKDQCTLGIRFGSGKVQSRRVSLGKAGESFKVPVPADAMAKATKVTVSLDCPKGVSGKFTLAAPAPVSFWLPAPTPSIEAVRVQGVAVDGKTVMTVLRGEKVYFTAEGGAKKYIWTFSDQKPLEKGNFRTFDEIGNYSFTVWADGNEKSKKSGDIKVVDIGGLKIRNQGDAMTVPDAWQSFEATVEKDKLPPSKCTWYVVGPILKRKSGDPEPKESLSVVELDSQTNMLRNRHFFKKPGDYKVRITATYDKFPRNPAEAETPWIVSERAEIAFSKSMKGDGHRFEFGSQVELAIDVTAGAVDEKSIVWKADGKEIGRGAKLTAPAVRGQGQITKVYSVEALDKVLKKPLSLKRTYFYGCNHEEPIVEARRKDGSVTWGVYDEVNFAVSPGNSYKDIVWTFGDDPDHPRKVQNGQIWPHHFVKAGEFTNTMTCKCSKCGTTFTKTLKTKTKYVKPVPALGLEPEKRHFVKSDHAALYDAGSGDYFACRVEKKDPATGKFTEYKTLPRGFKKEQLSFGSKDFPVSGRFWHWADFELRLVPLDKAGNVIEKDKDGKPVVPSVRAIGVRPYPSSTVIPLICLIALFAIIFYLLSKVLLCNEPRGWELFSDTQHEEPPLERGESQRVVDDSISSTALGEGNSEGKFWSRFKHQASIPLSEFLSGYSGGAVLKIDPFAELKQHKYYFEKASFAKKTLPCNPGKSGVVFEIELESGDAVEKIYLELVLDEENNYHGDAILYWGLLSAALLTALVGGVVVFRWLMF